MAVQLTDRGAIRRHTGPGGWNVTLVECPDGLANVSASRGVTRVFVADLPVAGSTETSAYAAAACTPDGEALRGDRESSRGAARQHPPRDAAAAHAAHQASEAGASGGQDGREHDEDHESGAEGHDGGDEAVVEADAELPVDARLERGHHSDRDGETERQPPGEAPGRSRRGHRAGYGT